MVSSLQLHNYQIALLQPGISALLQFWSLWQSPKRISTVPAFLVSPRHIHVPVASKGAQSRLSSSFRNDPRLSKIITIGRMETSLSSKRSVVLQLICSLLALTLFHAINSNVSKFSVKLVPMCLFGVRSIPWQYREEAELFSARVSKLLKQALARILFVCLFLQSKRCSKCTTCTLFL